MPTMNPIFNIATKSDLEAAFEHYRTHLLECHNLQSMNKLNKAKQIFATYLGFENYAQAEHYVTEVPFVESLLHKILKADTFTKEELHLIENHANFHLWNSSDYFDLEFEATYRTAEESGGERESVNIHFTIDRTHDSGNYYLTIGTNEGEGWEPDFDMDIVDSTDWRATAIDAIAQQKLNSPIFKEFHDTYSHVYDKALEHIGMLQSVLLGRAKS